MSPRFLRLELRTTDFDHAIAFYRAVLGADVESRGREARLVRDGITLGHVTVLAEAARAHGAPAHWLGHVGVPDVERSVEAMLARGASRLGPPRMLEDGVHVIGLREPGGAPFALVADSGAPAHGGAAWHELNTTDLERSFSFFAEPFGWVATGSIDFGPILGPYRRFAFAAGEPDAGGMIAMAGKNGVHPHWLFYFTTNDLEGAMRNVIALGGEVFRGPHTVPSGDLIALCHDAEGAAFGLRQPGV
jgi:predicted enzyme related to lactoylglutathione lyase